MWFGWGAPPDYDRALGRALVLFSLWTVVFPAGYVIVRNLLDGFSLASTLTSRPFVTLVIGIAAITSPGWAAGACRLWLAARGAERSMSTAYGHCFATLLSPSAYFARIGLSPTDARWYALPLTWDVTVIPGEAEFELHMNPVTGYVERLRRLEGAPVDLRQDAPLADLRIGVQRVEPSAGAATKEQRRELYRVARRENLRWAINPTDIVVTGWTFIISGLILGFGQLAVAVYLLLTYPVHFAPGGKEAGIAYLSFFVMLGVALIAGGIYLLRVWGRVRSLSGTPAETLEGTVVVWTPYKNFFSSGKGFLVNLRPADGSKREFLVPQRYAHRVTHAGNRVAITYLPDTSRVLDVRPLEYVMPAH